MTSEIVCITAENAIGGVPYVRRTYRRLAPILRARTDRVRTVYELVTRRMAASQYVPRTYELVVGAVGGLAGACCP